MQFETKQLERQQLLLASLKFYSGKIDGLWGPLSIAAKKKYESDTRFLPGIPNNGMPFGSRPPYPAGVSCEPVTGLLLYDGLDTSLMNPKHKVTGATVSISPKEQHVNVTKVDKTETS